MSDFLAQREVLFARALLGLLAVFNVGSRRIPAHEMALFVVERIVLNKEPTILAILSQRSLFDLEWNAACQRLLAFVVQPLHIVRMIHPSTKVCGHHLIQGETGVIEHGLVRVDRNSVGVLDNNGLRYRICNPAELALVSLQLLLRTLTVFDVRAGSVP